MHHTSIHNKDRGEAKTVSRLCKKKIVFVATHTDIDFSWKASTKQTNEREREKKRVNNISVY